MESNHSIQKSNLLRALLVLIFMAIPLQWATAQLTLSTTRTNLGTVIKQIQSQSKYQFFYNDKLSATQVEAVNVKDASLEQVLNSLLSGTSISYKVEDNIVYLSEKNAQQTNQQQVGQEHTITGQVIDTKGEMLIGVSILQKGTSNGTITDMDGNYTLKVSGEQPVLVFSYIGYKTLEIPGNKPTLNVTMSDDTQVIDEVVVTALGIKREKKMLGYAVQEIKSDQLNKTGDPSVTSALQGKVAGLQMNTAGTGLGGSTKITIRGNSSLSDNNQPLWIIDGVPFSDNNSSDASYYGGVDRGGASVDINPDDIETISVLKGPNAAALYGSRAGNGVILITTKKGSKKEGFGVRYSGNFTWSTVAETLKMQERYGQGTDGVYNKAASSSWGSELDGHMVEAWNGEQRAYSKYGNKLKDYFNTGFAHNHNVSISNVTDKSHFRASFGSSNNKGLFPNEKLDKINIDLNAGAEMNQYLSMEGKVSLSRTKAEDRPYFGSYGVIAQLIGIPHNVSLDDLKNYSTENSAHVNWAGPNPGLENPYYVQDQRHNSDERWRAFGYYNAKINFTDWLHFSAKYAFDYYRTRVQSTDLSNGIGKTIENITDDRMSRSEENFFESNAEFILAGDNRIGENFRIGYTVGANFMYQKFETLSAETKDMVNKNQWIFNAANILNSAAEDGHERATNSVFASAQLAWKEYLSMDLTARNDWSSTLPSSNRSFFYPSANLSFIITDFLRSLDKTLPSWLTFAKVRLSAAQVGKDTEPYNLYNTLSYAFSNGVLNITKSDIKKNDQLKPEISSSYEAGLDMKFLNNRLGFDFTYYYSSTKNQAMLVDASSPWSQQWVNAGKISNKGVEMMIYSTPVQTKDFRFDLGVNLAKNISTVDELANGVNHIYFSGDPNMPVKVGAVPGGKLGNIYANNLMKRDAQGNVVVGSDGLPIPETGNGNLEQYILDHPIGNIEPNLLMSVTPSSYKGFTLSAMFDMKFGGDIVCVSEGMATAVGTAKRTEYRGEYKEINGVKDYYMVVPGVKEDGSLNDIPVSAQTYYSTIGLYKSAKGYAEEFVYDASYIKLKELSIGYNFPSRILKKTPFTALKLSFVGRNLCFLLKHTPGNPDGGYDTTMFSQALDYAAVPYTRTFGFSINVGF